MKSSLLSSAIRASATASRLARDHASAHAGNASVKRAFVTISARIAARASSSFGTSLVEREGFVVLAVPVHHRGHVLRRARCEHRIDVTALLLKQVYGRRTETRYRLLQPLQPAPHSPLLLVLLEPCDLDLAVLDSLCLRAARIARRTPHRSQHELRSKTVQRPDLALDPRVQRAFADEQLVVPRRRNVSLAHGLRLQQKAGKR